MEYLPTNRILEFNPNQMYSVRKEYNLHKPGDMDRSIDVLEEWVKGQKHFMKKDLPRNYLEKTILAGKGSLERAKQRLDKICTFRTVMPDFFGDNLTKNNFENMNVLRCTFLPKPTNENYRVSMLKVVGSRFTYEEIMDCYKYVVMMCEYILAHDYTDGLIVLFDHTEVDLIELVKSVTLTELHQIFTIMTEGFGLRVKGLHQITPSKISNAFVVILKQVLSPKLGKRIHVHKDTSTLYQYVPREILPVEYGGNEKSFTELHDKLRDELIGDFRTYLEEINIAKTDESCRDASTFNQQYLGVPGSFRLLNVD